MTDLGPAVDTVVNRCLGDQAGRGRAGGRRPGTRAIGDRLRDAAAAAGADAVLAVMAERENDGTEPPPTIAAALSAATCSSRRRPARSATHRPQARDRQRRAGRDDAGRHRGDAGRVMAVDFDTMARRSSAVAELLDEASARTSPARAAPT